MYFRYRHRLLLVPKYMHIQFETSRQNKNEENLNIIKKLILLRVLLRFM